MARVHGQYFFSLSWIMPVNSPRLAYQQVEQGLFKSEGAFDLRVNKPISLYGVFHRRTVAGDELERKIMGPRKSER